MCGIVGLSCRTDRYQGSIGELFVPMLECPCHQGPGLGGYRRVLERPAGCRLEVLAESAWRELPVGGCGP